MGTPETRGPLTGAARGEAAARRGRPRDTAIDERILAAAKAVYSERGGAGFNFDTVARRARVSKDAVYRRYGSRLELLTASRPSAEEVHRYELALSADAGIRDYLIAVAKDRLVLCAGEACLAHLRAHIEARHDPELSGARYGSFSPSGDARVLRAVRAAMNQGVLPLAGSATAVVDAVVGGTVMRFMGTPPTSHGTVDVGHDAQLTDLVDMVLRGCGYDFAADGSDAPPQRRS